MQRRRALVDRPVATRDLRLRGIDDRVGIAAQELAADDEHNRVGNSGGAVLMMPEAVGERVGVTRFRAIAAGR
jgi:hypothetical protein